MQVLVLGFILPLLININWIASGPLSVEAPAQAGLQNGLVEAVEPTRGPFAGQPAQEPISTTVATTSSPNASDAFMQQVEQLVFEKTNAERVANKLSPLTQDSELAAIARFHSKDMSVKNYFEHADPAGCNSACRAKDAGYDYYALGENIFLTSGLNLSAADAASLVVEGWMGSPGHRANILEKLYKKTGIGVFAAGGKVWATAMYSQPR